MPTKLTVEEVLEIRKLAKTMTDEELGKQFSVSPGTICAVVRRKSWKQVLPTPDDEDPKPDRSNGYWDQEDIRDLYATLNKSKVMDILGKIEAGASNSFLAKEYDVTPGCIRDVRHGKTWKSVYEKFYKDKPFDFLC